MRKRRRRVKFPGMKSFHEKLITFSENFCPTFNNRAGESGVRDEDKCVFVTNLRQCCGSTMEQIRK